MSMANGFGGPGFPFRVAPCIVHYQQCADLSAPHPDSVVPRLPCWPSDQLRLHAVLPHRRTGMECYNLSFNNLGLDERLLKAVRSMGYDVPTPIQQQAIPAIIDGKDVVGCAQTGTGKTAAFTLPTLQRVHAGNRRPAALIVTPTRELAVQIEGVAKQASRFTQHRVAVVYGGVGYGPQAAALRKGVDILVATPGRLLDLCNQGDCRLDRVEVLVLDEADRMLDMGFWPDVKRILGLLPSNRQNLLFSATMSPEVMRVAGDTLHEPIHIDIAPPSKPIDKIAQSVYPVSGQQKVDLLLSLIQDHDLSRVLIFTRTKHRADRVARVLSKNGISGAAIHGNRSQSQRQQALEGLQARQAQGTRRH